jgi:hypothetical protein
MAPCVVENERDVLGIMAEILVRRVNGQSLQVGDRTNEEIGMGTLYPALSALVVEIRRKLEVPGLELNILESGQL